MMRMDGNYNGENSYMKSHKQGLLDFGITYFESNVRNCGYNFGPFHFSLFQLEINRVNAYNCVENAYWFETIVVENSYVALANKQDTKRHKQGLLDIGIMYFGCNL